MGVQYSKKDKKDKRDKIKNNSDSKKDKRDKIKNNSDSDSDSDSNSYSGGNDNDNDNDDDNDDDNDEGGELKNNSDSDSNVNSITELNNDKYRFFGREYASKTKNFNSNNINTMPKFTRVMKLPKYSEYSESENNIERDKNESSLSGGMSDSSDENTYVKRKNNVSKAMNMNFVKNAPDDYFDIAPAGLANNVFADDALLVIKHCAVHEDLRDRRRFDSRLAHALNGARHLSGVSLHGTNPNQNQIFELPVLEDVSAGNLGSAFCLRGLPHECKKPWAVLVLIVHHHVVIQMARGIALVHRALL